MSNTVLLGQVGGAQLGEPGQAVEIADSRFSFRFAWYFLFFLNVALFT